MKFKSKMLFSTIAAAVAITGTLSLPHSLNVSAALKPVTGLELSDGEVTGTSVDVRGWALNESGVAAADLYVDGKYVTTEDSYKSRPDVQKCFPEYKDAANSGYDFTVDLAPGKHTIRVYDIGKDGVVIYKQATINVQSKNPPRMGLELSDGEETATKVDIRGWALNESGVAAADLYVDGKYVTTDTVYRQRPDVQKCFPEYKNAASSGYDFNVSLAPGKHTIRVYDIGKDGAVIYKEATINVKGRVSRTGLELSNGQKISGPLEIRGWTLNTSGTKAVDVYIDGHYTKTLEPSEERPDVVKAFPEYADELKCGFDYDASYLGSGYHKIMVYGIGNDGTTTYQEATVFYQNSLGTRIGLELHDNEKVGEIVDVRGWAVDADEIKAVDIYVDGKYAKTVSQSEFETRPDVMKAFPQYQYYGNKDKCGFDYKLQLSEGKHNIKVYAISASNDVVLGSQEANVISEN